MLPARLASEAHRCKEPGVNAAVREASPLCTVFPGAKRGRFAYYPLLNLLLRPFLAT